MKAFIRVIVVLAVVFIIIGLAIAVSVGVIKGPAFLNRINEGTYATSDGQNTIEMSKNEFDRILIDIANANVTFKPVEGYTATIVYDVFEGDKITELKGSDFGLDEEYIPFKLFDITTWFRFWWFNDRDIEISIPEDSMTALSISIINGRISGGNVNLKGTKISATNAGIDINDITADGDVTINNTNGAISLENISGRSIIKCVNTNGKIESQNLTANKVEMINTNGKVSGLRLLAKDIHFVNTNGPLDATVIGAKEDFNIILNTTNGKFKVDGEQFGNRVALNPAKDMKITFNTTNGGGTLDFVGN